MRTTQRAAYPVVTPLACLAYASRGMGNAIGGGNQCLAFEACLAA